MDQAEHDRLYFDILAKHSLSELAERNESRFFFDRLGKEIPYGHWKCLKRHKEYYLVDEVEIEDYVISAIWIGEDPGINIPANIYAVIILNIFSKIKLKILCPDEESSRRFLENMVFFVDQNCMEEYIDFRLFYG